MDIRPNGVGRLTRVVICGLLAATAFPASALADGLVGSVPVTAPSVPAVPVPSVPTPSVSAPSVPVPSISTPSVSTSASTHVSTPVATAGVSVSANTGVALRAHASVATHPSRSKARRKGTIRRPSVTTTSTVAAAVAGARTLASTLQVVADFPMPTTFVNPCNGETVIVDSGTIHFVTQPDVSGGTKVQTNTQGVTAHGFESGLAYTISEETHTYTVAPNEDLYDYRKIIRKGETGEIIPDDAHMLIKATIPIGPKPDFTFTCN